MNVLLINPDSRYERVGVLPPIIPYGLLYLAAVLRKNGHSVRIFDRNAKNSETLKEVIEKFRPKIIGVSTMTGFVIKDAVNISQFVKKYYPQIVIIWGGVHPTLLPEQTLREDFVDIVVRKEGEHTIVDLVAAVSKQKKLQDVQGISYKRSGKIFHNPDRPYITDLDSLPDPAWDLIDMKQYGTKTYYTLNTSRGCPFNCTFCYNQHFSKKRRVDLSVDKIINQILYLKNRYGVTYLKFMEDNFTFNKKRLDCFCREIIDRKMDLTWVCESRIDWLNYDMLKLMYRAGCRQIGFGVESGSEKVLKLLKKGFRPHQIDTTLSNCFKAGIKADIFIMTGIPTETMEDFNKTIDMLKRVKCWAITFMVFHPYPGSELYDYCVENGLFKPPIRLEEWASFGDVYSTENYVGEIPARLIDDFMLKDKRNIELRKKMEFLWYNNKKELFLKVPVKSYHVLSTYIKTNLLSSRKLVATPIDYEDLF